MNSRHHASIQQVPWLVNARSIDENDLAIVACDDSLDAVPGRLRFVRNGRDLFADEAVEQRRLARVRASDEGHIAAAKSIACHHLERYQSLRAVQTTVRFDEHWRLRYYCLIPL